MAVYRAQDYLENRSEEAKTEELYRTLGGVTPQSYEEFLDEQKKKEDIRNAKIGPELTKEQQKRVRKLLKEWEHVFAQNPYKPPHYNSNGGCHASQISSL
jgi:hypothetical protein